MAMILPRTPLNREIVQVRYGVDGRCVNAPSWKKERQPERPFPKWQSTPPCGCGSPSPGHSYRALTTDGGQEHRAEMYLPRRYHGCEG